MGGLLSCAVQEKRLKLNLPPVSRVIGAKIVGLLVYRPLIDC